MSADLAHCAAGKPSVIAELSVWIVPNICCSSEASLPDVSHQVGRLYVLIGLPGSGKSTFLRRIFHDERPDVLILDDYQANAIASQPDPQWSRNRPAAVEALRSGQPVLISDVTYCSRPALDRVTALMREEVPGIDIQLIYFANDPTSAEHNVRLRGRDGLERELELIEALSKNYQPPEDAMPIIRGTPLPVENG